MKPTITIAVIGHGEDLINKPINDDPNVRIFSRAGQSFCYGIATKDMLSSLYEIYDSEERTSDKSKKSSYQMLREVADYYNTNKHDTEFNNLCDTYITNIKAQHTKKNIQCKGHNKIYIPTYDHVYYFTDNTSVLANQNGIFVMETINHEPKGKIKYEIGNANLALRKYFIKYPERYRNLFNEQIITDFLQKFKLECDELELKRYSNEIFKLFPSIELTDLIKEINNNNIEIRNVFSESDYNKISEKAKELILRRILLEEDPDIKKQLQKQRADFLNSVDLDKIIETIKLSEIIEFLKSEGFEVINIIDFTCRSVPNFLNDAYTESETEEDKAKKERKIEEIKQYKENQEMGFEEINEKLGGRKKRITRKMKKHRKTKHRKNKNKK
jgi:hypothetical protein